MNDKYFTGEPKKPMTELYRERLACWTESANRALVWTGLLADSRPLFEAPLQAKLRAWMAACRQLGMPAVQGVYVGASNGDEPQYFDIAQGFFTALGIDQTQHWQAATGQTLPLPSQPSLVVLAGGSVLRGWQALNAEPWLSWLRCEVPVARVVIGISAGAIQLTGGLDDQGQVWRGLGLQDLMLSVHDEATDWLSCSILRRGGVKRTLCLPFGSAACLQNGRVWAVSGEPFWATCRDAG